MGSSEFIPPTSAYSTSRRVEFCHTDAGGIMHFSGYFEMMEQAEHELLRDAGLSVVMHRDGKTLSWPRVSAKCDYTKPARFEDMLELSSKNALRNLRSSGFIYETHTRQEWVSGVGSGSRTGSRSHS